VAIEVAIAIVLLVGTGLLIRTAIHLQRVDPGFDPSGVLTARVTLPAAGYQEWDRVTAAFTRLAAELARAPGVERAGLSSQVPLGPGGNYNGLIPEGRPLETASSIGSRFHLVTPGLLGAMGIRLVEGRDFSPDDRPGSPRVMIVSAAFARHAWPGVSAVGKRVLCCEGTPSDPMWKEVVGVAADVRTTGLDQDVGPEFYLPVQQAPTPAWDWIQRSMMLVARGPGGTAALAAAMREAVRAVDPGVPLYAIASMDERIAGSLARSRFNTAMLTVLGTLGLLLAAVGIYGVIAYFVTRRTREIGVRIALGASSIAVVRLVARQGFGPVVVGLGLGLGGALVATRVLETQLRGVARTDPATFAGVALLALVVAGLATLGPARRATRTDTVIAMREE
jgi:predicted permease